tara:strand:+ start:105 stop:809 length:705 start_codon:yes stop_codon:yes gene_type:complete
MAYVRKTDTLVQHILHKVRQMSQTAQKPYSADTLTKESAEYDAIRNCIESVSWKGAPQLKQQMPDEWLDGLKTKNVDVKIIAPESCPDSGDVNIYLEGDFTLSPAHASAGHSYSGNRGKMTLEEADFPPILMTWFKSGKSNESIKKSLQDKFNKIEEQLKSFMEQHASLNTAIKELPQIEQYIPEEYIEKLHAPSAPRGKVQRAEKTTVEDLGIDRDALTSAAVAHQLTRDSDD